MILDSLYSLWYDGSWCLAGCLLLGVFAALVWHLWRTARRELGRAGYALQAEKEDAVFSSGAIIGTVNFIDRIVRTEVEAFPNGYKSPSTAFSCGDTKLMTLRRLEALR